MREKSDAQVIVQNSKNNTIKEIEGFRKEIEDLITMGGSIGNINHQQSNQSQDSTISEYVNKEIKAKRKL